MHEVDLNRISTILHRIATGRRIRIIKILIDAGEPIASSTIAAVAGMTEAAASFNLMKLAEVGVVIRLISGRWVFYQINREVLKDIRCYFTEDDQ